MANASEVVAIEAEVIIDDDDLQVEERELSEFVSNLVAEIVNLRLSGIEDNLALILSKVMESCQRLEDNRAGLDELCEAVRETNQTVRDNTAALNGLVTMITEEVKTVEKEVVEAKKGAKGLLVAIGLGIASVAVAAVGGYSMGKTRGITEATDFPSLE